MLTRNIICGLEKSCPGYRQKSLANDSSRYKGAENWCYFVPICTNNSALQFANHLGINFQFERKTSLKSMLVWKRSPRENRTLFSLCGVYRMLSFSALNIDRLLETLGVEDSLQWTATCITSPLDHWVVYWRFHVSDWLITLDNSPASQSVLFLFLPVKLSTQFISINKLPYFLD